MDWRWVKINAVSLAVIVFEYFFKKKELNTRRICSPSRTGGLEKFYAGTQPRWDSVSHPQESHSVQITFIK